MDYNYHTHTYLCSHADGTMEEYVKCAIAGGIKYMGFSDHAPFVRKDGKESYYRVPVDKVKGYFEEAYRLKEKYKDKIEISVGFEMEYYPDDFEKMLDNVVSCGAEYLILGEHFICDESDARAGSAETEDEEFLKKYVCAVVSAIKSGAFTYVAHPDMFNFVGDIGIYNREMMKICQASKECNIPLEINLLGIRSGRHYPAEKFWTLAGKAKCPVTFGFDAHDAANACDRASLKKAMELVEKYKLNYIGKPKLVLLQEN